MATASDEMRVKKGKIFVISLIVLGIMVAIPFLFSVFMVPYGRMLSKKSISTREKVEQVAQLPPPTPLEPVAPAEPVPPASVTPPLSNAQKQAVQEAIESATRQRYNGNFQAALDQLRRALDIAPDSTEVHVALAELYEAFDDKLKAIESWQRVLELAPDASSRIHAEAREKLDNVRKKLDEQGAKAQSGIPLAGAGLFVVKVDAWSEENPLFDHRLTLNIEIGSRDRRSYIDPAKVKIQVYFYDLLSNNQVVSTKARVKASFQDSTVDWLDGNEWMQVVYEVPKGTWQKELKETGISRNLYGYLVRIYYDDNLEDVYADPSQLEQLFPAKQKLAP